jgi:magnesium chelatase family protein
MDFSDFFPNHDMYKRWFEALLRPLLGAFSDPGVSSSNGLLKSLILKGNRKNVVFESVKQTCRMATQECPCGYFGSDTRRCKCTPGQIARYLAKVSGPLVDRIDIHIDVPAISFRKLRSKAARLDSMAMRLDVVTARGVQTERFAGGNTLTNAVMTHKQVEKFCTLDSAGELILKQAMVEFGLSARAHDKVCKVARTIADLAGARQIQPEHIAEAVSYRRLDRKL